MAKAGDERRTDRRCQRGRSGLVHASGQSDSSELVALLEQRGQQVQSQSNRRQGIVQRGVKAFEFSDVELVFPNESTGILSYRVKQRVAPRGKGGTAEQEMNDTSPWIKTDRGWRWAMHTEMPVKSR
jgi:hypothetical protein